MAITKISPDVVDFDSALVVSPTLTIGDATAEDTKIVFDGNAQDFYIGLDDSADDLLIGLGSTVGTTPAISVDEDQKVTLPKKFTVDGADGAIDNDWVAFFRNQEGTDDRNFGLYVVGGSTSSDVAFRIDNQRTGGGNAFHVNGDGKVGINIAAPARRLLEIQDTTPGIVLHDSDVTNLTHEIVGGGNAGLEISADYQNVGTGYIRFDVGGSERARILESGNFNIEDGNLVVASGHGIDFSANSHATGMTSELLDSYEEGSWSPAISSGTATFSNARYTKIGRLVRFSYQVQGMDDITSNNHILVTGLPFPVQAGEAAGVAFGTYTDNASANVVYATDSETVYLYSMSSGTWDTMLHSELNSNGNYQYVAGTYQAES